MAKKYTLKNKPIDVGSDDRHLSFLSDESKEQLKKAIAQKQIKKDAKTVDITEYLPEQYEQKIVPLENLVAAPDEWNFFSKPSKEKIIALAESIYYNGLLQPIVVREMENGTFQILAGHTRVEAYKALRDTLNDESYGQIAALAFPFNSLTDIQAEDIVCDTNFMQRGTLSTIETAKCIQLKARRLRGDNVARSKDNIAAKISEYYHIKRAMVFRWQRIANLIPELIDLSEKRQLTADSMYKLSAFSSKDQERLYKRAADYISNNTLRHVKAKHKLEDVIHLLKDDKVRRTLRYSVSAEDLNDREPILILVNKNEHEDVLTLLNKYKLILM